ncbi:MAG TPA: S9 family peptidase [Planctomycetota bacterium]
MSLRTPFLAIASCVLLAAQGRAQYELLSLEQASGRGGFVQFGGRAPSWSWAPDGIHLLEGRGGDAKWYDPRSGKEVAAQPGAAADAAPQARVRVREGRLWLEGADGSSREILADAAGVELEELAPDGSYVAFVKDNDLMVAAADGGKPRAITTDGGPDLFNGKLDWVYQEEIYGRGNFKAFWWSPNSKHLAFLSLDESAVHDFTVVDHIEPPDYRVKAEVTKYPKVGDPNPTVRLGVVDPARGKVQWLDLSSYADPELLVVRVGWHPRGTHVVFMVQDRIQSWLDLVVGDPKTGKIKVLIHEESNSWVERPQPPRWLEDGSFLWESHRTGWRHLYRYSVDGKPLGAVTQGEWEMRGVDHVDEKRGLVWFNATKDGAVNDNHYRIGLNGKGLVRLTPGEGRHSVAYNGDRSLAIDTVSSLASLPVVRLCDDRGEVLRELGEADAGALDQYRSSNWELHEIAARDGFELDVALLKPANFDPARGYPVWLPTYSGPDAPTVRNSWNGSAWYQFLAQQGVIVLQVNVRSASGKGHYATEQCYRRLGVQELADLEDAVAWLTAKPWADAGRIGITGSSYGGFMSAYALTHSDKFALGIAASGVYAWEMYDTVYTERYMSTRQLNPEGYASTSVLNAAADLKGHLILTHGTIDDNVHMQNAMQLVYALQKADQDFELMLYPENRHGIGDRDQRWFARRQEWAAIQEHLRPPGPAPAASK